jgi:y4mF family transcriptional regulator
MWANSAADVGKIIIAARHYRGLTQSELAKATGATQSWVSEVEQGKDTAQIGKVLRTLAYLGVRLNTGVSPWDKRKSGTSSPKGPSLSDILDAHVHPKRPGHKT